MEKKEILWWQRLKWLPQSPSTSAGLGSLCVAGSLWMEKAEVDLGQLLLLPTLSSSHGIWSGATAKEKLLGQGDEKETQLLNHDQNAGEEVWRQRHMAQCDI